VKVWELMVFYGAVLAIPFKIPRRASLAALLLVWPFVW
jgi:hypothetical protein